MGERRRREVRDTATKEYNTTERHGPVRIETHEEYGPSRVDAGPMAKRSVRADALVLARKGYDFARKGIKEAQKPQKRQGTTAEQGLGTWGSARPPSPYGRPMYNGSLSAVKRRRRKAKAMKWTPPGSGWHGFGH